MFQCLEKLFVFYLIDVLYVKVGETGRVAQVLQPPRSVICQRKIPNKKLSTFDLNKKNKQQKNEEEKVIPMECSLSRRRRSASELLVSRQEQR